jgi:hypothetical protein
MTNEIVRYKNIAKDLFKENKLLLVFLGLVCFLGFGFTITHNSIGIDNTAYDVYLESRAVIGQGRPAPLLINLIFGSYGINPFWSNAFGVLILYFSVILWSVLFMRVGKEKISKGALIIFALIMVSYPMINEHFIFVPFTFAICYGLTAISLMAIYEAYKAKKIVLYLLPIFLITFIISMNESFVPVVLCGIFFILILEYIKKENEKTTLKHCLKLLLVTILVIVIALGLEALITSILRKVITHTPLGAGNTVSWFKYPILYSLKTLVLGFVYRYILAAYWYSPIAVFLASGFLGVVIAIFLAIKKKQPIILLLMFGLLISVISLHLISGHIVPYRANPSFAVFIGFVLMLIMMMLKPHWLKVCYGVIIMVLVVNQTRILNKWFVNDYQRYEKDKEIAVEVAMSIERDFDQTKPIVFVGETAMAPQVEKVSANGRPIIGWSIVSFDFRAMQFHNFLEYHGHQLNKASGEQYDEGKALAGNMPDYPNKGYIKELDEFIVVNFGDNYKWILCEKEEKVEKWILDVLENMTNMDREYLVGQLATSIN